MAELHLKITNLELRQQQVITEHTLSQHQQLLAREQQEQMQEEQLYQQHYMLAQ